MSNFSFTAFFRWFSINNKVAEDSFDLRELMDIYCDNRNITRPDLRTAKNRLYFNKLKKILRIK